LKKAPPEYRDLPGVGGPSQGRPAAPADPSSAPTDASGERPEEPVPAWEEPGLAEVEAAADRLAEEFGSAPGGEPAEPRASGEPGEIDSDLLPEPDQPLRTTRGMGEPGRLTGPTWEEPTGSRPLMGEPALPTGIGRDLPAAVLTGVALVVVAAISLAVAKAAFAVVAGAIVLIGQAELYAAMHRKGYQPATALGLVVGGLLLAGAFLKGETAMLFFLALGLILSLLWYMAGSPKARENAIQNIGSTLLGLVYVPFLAGYVFVLLSQPRSGRALMLVVIGLSVAYDIAAFFFGTFWGSHALAPSISPKKSREGLYGATVVTFALSIGLVPTVIKYLSLADAVGLAVIVSVFAPLGDLAESALKRDLGVKDMGAVLPGHGGVLDRIDSILFVAPAALYFLRLIL